MRLLKIEADGSFSLINVVGKNTLRYAILSHTWESDDQEVTYRDIVDGVGAVKVGYSKIDFCGKQANRDGLQYFWVDSCCIDKSNNNELTEAINSMFRWYRDAVKCYAYLSDIPTPDIDSQAVCQSRWFTRGWTLQELIAPQSVEFFSRNGQRLGDKRSLEHQIHPATNIPVSALKHPGGLAEFSVEERMSWATNRETTIEEDQAYCLLGIFGVFMPLIYGEGKENAFRRLQVEISTTNGRDAPRRIAPSSTDRSDACLSSLEATDQTRWLSQTLNHSKNACSWIFENKQFVSWRESKQSSLLGITAKAGYGKTTLATHLCQMYSLHQALDPRAPLKADPEGVMLYFFFQRSNDETLKTGLAALRTIIRQLVGQVPATLPVLLRRYEMLSAKGDFSWAWENVSSVFMEMVVKCPPDSTLYIIFDALDECDPESRILLLDWVKEIVDANTGVALRGSPQEAVKILVTSRPDGDMNDHLSGFPTLEITNDDTADDMTALIRKRVEELTNKRHLKPHISQSIIQFFESNANGMFLWVVLVMKELEKRDQRLSDEAILAKLSSLPLTLAGTYEAVIQNTPATRKEDMWRIFRWLLFGGRSLDLAELEIALCLETGTSSWHDFAGDLNFLCGSLIRISGPRNRVSFVHQTARDYLQGAAHQSTDAELLGINMEASAANQHLAAVTVQYLLRDDILLELKRALPRPATQLIYVTVMEAFFEKYPFLRYAIESWDFHARGVGTLSPATSCSIRKLLASQKRRNYIMRLTYFITKHTGQNVPHGHNLLHLACYFDIPWLVQHCISHEPISVHATGSGIDTPLIWASEMGSTECVQMLLDARADPNASEGDGWSALHWAARNGHLRIAALLLAHGASLHHEDVRNLTALDWAIERENWDVADLLRAYGDRDRL